jgi:hypothetical protein
VLVEEASIARTARTVASSPAPSSLSMVSTRDRAVEHVLRVPRADLDDAATRKAERKTTIASRRGQ